MPALLITCDVSFSDGTSKQVMIKPAAMIKFERQYNCGMTDIGSRTEHIMFLVWAQLVVDGVTVPVFDDWVRTVEDVQIADRRNPTSAPAGGAL